MAISQPAIVGGGGDSGSSSGSALAVKMTAFCVASRARRGKGHGPPPLDCTRRTQADYILLSHVMG